MLDATHHSHQFESGFKKTHHDKSADIYCRLRDLVLSDIYAPEKALNVRDLAEELHVSITPVREALVRLCAEELIYSIPNRGFFVKQLSLKEIVAEYELAFVVLTYALGKKIGDFNIDELPQPPANNLTTEENFSPGASKHVASQLTSYIQAIFEGIAASADNKPIISIVLRFIDRTHNYRDHELLRTPLFNQACQNAQDLAKALASKNSEAAQTHLMFLFALETDRFSETDSSEEFNLPFQRIEELEQTAYAAE